MICSVYGLIRTHAIGLAYWKRQSTLLTPGDAPDRPFRYRLVALCTNVYRMAINVYHSVLYLVERLTLGNWITGLSTGFSVARGDCSVNQIASRSTYVWPYMEERLSRHLAKVVRLRRLSLVP
ncbi:uncharacterized protein ZBAI_00618 [Zygosaccharomyces bailii ISA1307]|nr:uncharacterized protein ZBAI_00618 [Zygosaccharomyces bailii ISA1307]